MGDHIMALKPEQWGEKGETKLLIWLDAVAPMSNVNIAEMLGVMRENCLQVLSLSDDPSSVHHAFPLMRNSKSNAVGRFVGISELNFNIFNRDVFLCVQQLLKHNSYGWG